MSTQRNNKRYNRTVSHSSQVLSSFELEEKSHPIHSLSESVHHHIPTLNDPSVSEQSSMAQSSMANKASSYHYKVQHNTVPSQSVDSNRLSNILWVNL